MKHKTFKQFLQEQETPPRKVLTKKKNKKTVTYFYPLGVGGGVTSYGTDSGASGEAS